MPHSKSLVPLICYCIGVPYTSLPPIPLYVCFCCFFLGGHSNFVRCCCRASDHMRHSAGIPEFRSVLLRLFPPHATPRNKKLCKIVGATDKNKRDQSRSRPNTNYNSNITMPKKQKNRKKKTIAAKRTHVCGEQATKALTSKRIRAAKCRMHVEEEICI